MMTAIRIRAEKDAIIPPKINPPPWTRNPLTQEKENIMRSLPPAIYCHGAE